MTNRPEPPGGLSPPATASVKNGPVLDLPALARDICSRYRTEFPDEEERYGDAGNAWCVHDNQHLLNWAVGAVNGFVDFEREVAWLGRVLEAREFPVDRLARNLEISAEVMRGPAKVDVRVAGVLEEGAAFVRERGTFLD